MKPANAPDVTDYWELTDYFKRPKGTYDDLADAMSNADPMDRINAIGQPSLGGVRVVTVSDLWITAAAPIAFDLKLAPGIESLAVFGSAECNLVGNGLRNWLHNFGSGDSTIRLGRGRDQSETGSGNDRIYGQKGDDSLDGGDGNDRIFGGSGKDGISGGNGRDRLFGGDGNDDVFGGKGRDKVFGGAGDDRLSGGSDADRFVFRKGDGHDRIVDFGIGGNDIVDLSRHKGVASFDDLTFSRIDGELVADLGDGDSIAFVGMVRSEISADDFFFG